ncbi:MAG: type II CAAX endopeptidase family protein [Candidatus Thorarchaeota archaeon]
MPAPSSDRHAGVFFLLVMLIGAMGYVPAMLSSYGIIPTDYSVLALLGGVSPLIAALIASRRSEGPRGPDMVFSAFGRRSFPGRWYVVAILLPVIMFAAAILLSSVSGNPYNLQSLNLMLFVPAFLSSIVMNVWEEIGWRGYALPKLQERHGAMTSGVVVGVFWALWHWPLFMMRDSQMLANYGSYSVFFIDSILLSLVYVWLYNSTDGNLIIPTLFHAGTNAAGIVLLMETGYAMDSLYLMTVYAVAALLVIAFNPRDSLSRRGRAVLTGASK